MNDSKIPVRYAKAVFELALERNVIDQMYSDMNTILTICSMKEVAQVLDNPVITPQKRKEILVSLLGEMIEPLTLKFIDLIFLQGRENYLVAASRDFIDFTRKHRGIRQVTMKTAVPVSDRVREEIARVISESKSDKIEFIEQIDNSIIGGFIIRVDDSYIDASVRNRLNRFRKEFSLAENAKE